MDRSKDEERARIAREMHDGLAQTLAGLRFRVRTWSTLLASDPARLEAELRQVGPVLDETIQELRRVIFALRPVSLEDLGLLLSVSQLAERISQHYPVQVHTQLVGDAALLPTWLEHNAFRMIQESLQNALRHAQATHIWVTVTISPERLDLEIRDDGLGFDLGLLEARAQQGHLGLINLRERAALLKGRVSFDSSPGRGTCVRASLPLDAPGTQAR